MEKDSIFRIYSMTKSLTAVAAAILKDEGKLAFEDPVEKYIPSFKDIQVGEVSKDENGKYVVTMVPPSTRYDNSAPCHTHFGIEWYAGT